MFYLFYLFSGFFCLMLWHSFGRGFVGSLFIFSRLNCVVILFYFFLLENLGFVDLNWLSLETKDTLSPFNIFFNSWNQSLLLSFFAPLVFFFSLYNHMPQNILKITNRLLFFFVLNSYFFLLTENLGLFLLSFEGLLLVSLALLRLTSKSDRVLEALAEMFFWTLAGSVALLALVFFLVAKEVWTFEDLRVSLTLTKFEGFLVLWGFGVKIPLWPFFSWLLRAHVEASVEFSILLSGVIVKFGLLGLFKFLVNGAFFWTYNLLAGLAFLAIVEATLKIFNQRDLKRIVALLTIVEMNWICFTFALGGAYFEQIGAFLLVAHSLATATEFFLVETIYKRTGTRDFTKLGNLFSSHWGLGSFSFLALLVTLGFPGSSIFYAKWLFFSLLIHESFFLFLFFGFFLLLVLPLLLFRVWLQVLFGATSLNLTNQKTQLPLLKREWLLLAFGVVGSFVLGLCPDLIFTYL